uniref:Uncharacterized protein n=1 Tax=Rhizophora mucronata TaxID=61149 RepID=A0A2P2R4W3_RHIMU
MVQQQVLQHWGGQDKIYNRKENKKGHHS